MVSKKKRKKNIETGGRLNARATEIEHVGAVAQRAHIHLRAGYKWGDCPPPRPLPLQQVDIHVKKL